MESLSFACLLVVIIVFLNGNDDSRGGQPGGPRGLRKCI